MFWVFFMFTFLAKVGDPVGTGILRTSVLLVVWILVEASALYLVLFSV